MFVPRIARRLASAAQEATALTLMCVADCSMVFAQALKNPGATSVVPSSIKVKPGVARSAAPQKAAVPAQPSSSPSPMFTFTTKDHGEQSGIPASSVRVLTFTNDPDRSYMTFVCPNCGGEGWVSKSRASAEMLQSMKAAGARFDEVTLPSEVLEPRQDGELTSDDLIDLGRTLESGDVDIISLIDPEKTP